MPMGKGPMYRTPPYFCLWTCPAPTNDPGGLHCIPEWNPCQKKAGLQGTKPLKEPMLLFLPQNSNILHKSGALVLKKTLTLCNFLAFLPFFEKFGLRHPPSNSSGRISYAKKALGQIQWQSSRVWEHRYLMHCIPAHGWSHLQAIVLSMCRSGNWYLLW